jgi:hypothetical protein
MCGGATSNCVKARRKRIAAVECNIVKDRGETKQSIGASGLGADDVRFGDHADVTATEWPIHQRDLDFDGRTRLDALRTEEKHAARTDVSSGEADGIGLSLSCDARDAEREAQVGARVGAAIVCDADGMCRYAANASGPGAFDPLRSFGRVHCARRAQSGASAFGFSGR